MKVNRKLIFNFQFSIFNLTGQALVEVIVAMAVVVALAVSLVSANLITQKAARSAKNNTQATKLSQQNIEQMRVFRDRKGFGALSDGLCWKLVSSDPDPKNWQLINGPDCPEVITLGKMNFNRKISISTDVVDPNKKLITVTVSSVESSGTQSVVNKTYLTTWCPGGIVPGSPCPSP